MDATPNIFPEGHAGSPDGNSDLSRSLEDWLWLGRLCAKLVADPGLAEDARAEAWLRGESRHSMFLAARRFVWRTRRSERRRAAREEAAAVPEALPSTEELVLRSEQQRRVWDQLMELEEPYRSALLLRFQEGLEPKEIAAREGVPADTVRWRLRRGVEKLRAQLEEDQRGGGLSAVALGVPPGLLGLGELGTAAAGASAKSLLPATAHSGVSLFTLPFFVIMLKSTAALCVAALVAAGAFSVLDSEVDVVLPSLEPIAATDSARPEDVGLAKVSDRAPELVPIDIAAGAETAPELAVTERVARSLSSVVGRVLQPTGQPLASAQVRIQELDRGKDEDDLFSAVLSTGADGRFAAEVPYDSLGRYEVTATGSDYQSRAIKRLGKAPYNKSLELVPLLPAGAPEATDMGDFQLQAACVLTGRLMAPESGTGVADVRAYLGHVLQFMELADDGTFRVPCMAPGKGRIEFRSPGRRSQIVAYTGAANGDVSLGEIELALGQTLAGVVLDPDGTPVVDAEVYTMAKERTRTDSEGRFELIAGKEGSVSIYARKAGVGVTQTRASEADGVDLVLQLIGEAPVGSFRVEDRESGEPVLQYGYQALSLGRAGTATFPQLSWPEPVTRETAEFRARCRREGDSLRVTAPGYRAISVGVREAAFTDVQVIKLRRAPSIVGTVHLDGKPVPFARIAVLAPKRGAHQPAFKKTQVLADAQGRFSIFAEPKSSVSLVAIRGDQRSSVVEAKTVRSGATDVGTLEIAACAPLQGRVAELSGAPDALEGHEIRVEGLLAASTTTDRRGAFSLVGLPEGDFTLRLVPRAGTSLLGRARSQTYSVSHAADPAAESSTVLEFELAASFESRLTVLLNGQPAAGLRVSLSNLDRSLIGERHTLDESGSCLYSSPFEGECLVTLVDGGRSIQHPVAVQFAAGSKPMVKSFEASDVELTLPSNLAKEDVMYGILKGTVTGAGVARPVRISPGQILDAADGTRLVRFELVPKDLEDAQLTIASGPTEYQLRPALERSLDLNLEAGETFRADL